MRKLPRHLSFCKLKNIMRPLLIFVSILFLTDRGKAAPALSSVYVRFVSGDQETAYGHETIGEGSSVQYVDVDGDVHNLRRRSVTLTSPAFSVLQRNENQDTLVTGPTISTVTPSKSTTTPQPREVDIQKRFDRVQFLPEDIVMETKGTKGIKRSPYMTPDDFGLFSIHEGFGGNSSPLENFGHSERRAISHSADHNLLNAESLAPEGLFLPPLPTAATEHFEDPYAADAETAKYAAQHPPYFHEFPHKRSILALNEERLENGLEPNILRSIRPFFPFFEISK